MKVLIIEDNAIQAMALETVVKKLGFNTVHIAFTGKQALTMIESFKPDILLVDIQLDSDITGVDIVKKTEMNGNFSVIYISGNTDGKYKELILETSFIELMTKPIDYNRLELLLAEVAGTLLK